MIKESHAVNPVYATYCREYGTSGIIVDRDEYKPLCGDCRGKLA